MEEQGLKHVTETLRGPFSQAFLADDPRAAPFLPPAFRSASERLAHVRRAAARSVSPALLTALLTAEERLPPSRARRENIDALAQPGSVVVVTGQQVGLFLGPLYTLYKAATAIVAARMLERETGVRCVPVFWLQTEDHDFEEIHHCEVLDREGVLTRLQLTSAPPARTSVKHARLGTSVEVALRQLETCIGPGEVLDLFAAWYQPERSVVDAFSGVLATLFADEGLVLVDPRVPPLAVAGESIHRRAVRDAAALSRVLRERERALGAAGFAVQVAVREGAPLSFFHPEGPTGPRHRLEPASAERFCFVGRAGEVSTQALLQAPADCFSTSALLRPILQDTLLPTACIVGGPGELNYFAQVAPLYEAFGLPMPMLLPRARFRLVEPRVGTLLEKLGLTAAQAEAPLATVMAQVRRPPPAGLTPEQLEARLTTATEEAFKAIPEEFRSRLDDAMSRTRGTIHRAASRMTGRYRHLLDTTDSVLGGRVRRVHASLYPHDEPQERVLGLASFAARAGLQPLVKQVLAAVEVGSTAVKELML